MPSIRLMSCLLAAVAMLLSAGPAAATEAAWARLADGGHTILLRHTRAPGNGDPSGMKIGDCSTQRNLSEEGRQQAIRIGLRLAARAVAIDAVLTSQWCRARDTARLAFPRSTVTEEPALNSFFADPSLEQAQTAAARALIAAFTGSGNQLMVTHQVNIIALTGIAPREGEAVIIDATPEGGVKVVGRLLFD
jgi:phosphohistidine phosphatase SixA